MTGRALIACALVAFTASDARADAREESRARYEQGTRFYNLGKFAEAIEAFEQAYQLDPDPVYLFNLAQAHRLAGTTERALFFYRRYLALAPDAANRADTERLIAELEAEPKPQAPTNPPAPPAPPAPQRFRLNVEAGISLVFLGDKTTARPPGQLTGRAELSRTTRHGPWSFDYGILFQYTTIPGPPNVVFLQVHGIAGAAHALTSRLSARLTVGTGFAMFGRLEQGNPINEGGLGSGVRGLWSVRVDAQLAYALRSGLDVTLGLLGGSYSPRTRKLDPAITRVTTLELFYFGIATRF